MTTWVRLLLRDRIRSAAAIGGSVGSGALPHRCAGTDPSILLRSRVDHGFGGSACPLGEQGYGVQLPDSAY